MAGSIEDGLKQLAGAESKINAFVHRHMQDEDGLLLCHVNVQTLKPWTNEQIKAGGYQLNFYDVRRGDAWGQLAYEDSLMATGEYASSRLLKHEVLGDAESLEEARVAVDALLGVLREGRKFERGYLPKPHGGMKNAAYSHEISVDQYIKTIVALLRWQTHASPEQSRLIDEHFVAMADYHLIRGFIHPRREHFIVTPENRTHGLALFIPLMVMAHRLTGDKQYLEALPRFDAVLDQLLADENPPTNCNIVGLFMDGFDLAMQFGHEDPRLKQILDHLWRARLALTHQLGLWNDDPGDKHPSSMAIRIAAMAPIVDHYFPQANASAMALQQLAEMHEPTQLLYANTQVENLHFRKRLFASSICATSVSSWLLAYWSLVRRDSVAGSSARAASNSGSSS